MDGLVNISSFAISINHSIETYKIIFHLAVQTIIVYDLRSLTSLNHMLQHGLRFTNTLIIIQHVNYHAEVGDIRCNIVVQQF